jgi:V-type H+-transporting ATPase subunit F
MVKERVYVGIIADEDTIIGFSLTGLGQSRENSNFIIVTEETGEDELTKYFNDLISREDIAAVFICDFAADKIRSRIKSYTRMLPSLLEIPSKSKRICNK